MHHHAYRTLLASPCLPLRSASCRITQQFKSPLLRHHQYRQIRSLSSSASIPPAASLLTPPQPAHVLIYGGGSMGLLHAGLLQLRFEADRRAHAATNESSLSSSSSAASCTSTPFHSTVCVISAQRDLVHFLHTVGLNMTLLVDFIRSNRLWLLGGSADHATMTPQQLEDVFAGASHWKLPYRIKLPSTCSVTTCPSLSLRPPTHALIMTKGVSALERAAADLYDMMKTLMLQDPSCKLPSVCLVMNGLGHRERMIEFIRVRLSAESDPILSPSEQASYLAAFESNLYLATTTSGAKLEKMYALHRGGRVPELHRAHLKHGGVGMTTIIQNEAESKREKDHSSPVTSPATSNTNTGSSSLLHLFHSIGQPSNIASYASSQSILYTKLLINCAINPLTALYNIPNGALLDEKYTEQIVNIVQECVEVYRSLNIPIADYPPSRDLSSPDELSLWPKNISHFVTLEMEKDEELMRGLWHVYTTIQKTKSNYSSMHADLHSPLDVATPGAGPSPRRRTRTTEIDSITGHLLAKAKEAGIDADRMKSNQQMYDRIKLAERAT